MSEKISIPNTLQRLYEIREDVLNRLAEINKLKSEIDQIFTAANIPNSYSSIERKFKYGYDQAKQEVDRSLWYELSKVANLYNTMSSTAQRKFDDQIENNPPEFVPDNVDSIINNVQQLYGTNINQLIKEVYNNLIGCHYNGSGSMRKKDNLKRINDKFRITYYYHSYSYDSTGYMDLERNFADLYRLCRILDKKYDPLNYADQPFRTNMNYVESIETDYFHVRLHLNGNALVIWQRLDILEMINKYGGGQALPDVMDKRYKQQDLRF